MKTDRHSLSIPFDTLPLAHVHTDLSEAWVETYGNIATLYLDGAESSALDMHDPTYLEFEYMQYMAAAIHAFFPQNTLPLRMLHAGGAGCAFARAMCAQYPTSRHTVIEIDRLLSQYVRQWFALPRAPRLKIRNENARITLSNTHAAWDVVIRDTFIHKEIPTYMTTRECAQDIARITSRTQEARGIYLANTLSHPKDGFARELSAIGTAFPYVYAVSNPQIFAGRRMGNIVVIASHQSVDTTVLERELHRLALPARLWSPEVCREKARFAPPLTDQHVGWDAHIHEHE